jgi:spermidine synthase
MLPRTVLDSVITPEGRELVLIRRGDDFLLELDREVLMSSRLFGSEEQLARAVVERVGFAAAPRLLIGGLGMGFTVRAALDALGDRPRAVVEVAEVFQAVVDWNRGPLAELAEDPLADPRVRILVEDVARSVDRARDRYDGILLDVDNGPDAFTLDSNAAMYRPAGLARLRAALRPQGVLGIWSAYEDRGFATALDRAGFETEVRRVRARPGSSGIRCFLFVARRRERPVAVAATRLRGRSRDRRRGAG